MAKGKVDLTHILGTGLSTSSYPNPNTLGTKNPYSGLITDPKAVTPSSNGAYDIVSAAWTAQGSKMFIGTEQWEREGAQKPFKVAVMRSQGSSVTAVTLVFWVWVFDSAITGGGHWVNPASSPSRAYTVSSTIPGIVDYLNLPGTDPFYIEINAITGTGAVDIVYDGSVATAL